MKYMTRYIVYVNNMIQKVFFDYEKVGKYIESLDEDIRKYVIVEIDHPTPVGEEGGNK